MEENPIRETTPIDEDDRIVDIDNLAREGLLKKNDIPGFDLFDQHGDPTNVTHSGGTEDESMGPKDKVRRGEKLFAGGEGTGGLSIKDSLHEDDGEEDDAAARWLKENDPDYGKNTH